MHPYNTTLNDCSHSSKKGFIVFFGNYLFLSIIRDVMCISLIAVHIFLQSPLGVASIRMLLSDPSLAHLNSVYALMSPEKFG